MFDLKIENWDAFSALSSSVFNLLLFGAAVASSIAAFKSARAAKQGLIFNQEQNAKSEHEHKIMREVYQKRVKKDAEYINRTVTGQYSKLDARALMNARGIELPSVFEMGKFFDEDQIDILNRVWALYDKYYSEIWVDNETGEFSTVQYDTNKQLVRNESFRLGNEIKGLIEKL